jgi:adenine/guanine phosphoribosyltransferase-like PRPP-binding protein
VDDDLVQTWQVDVGSQSLDLPIVPVSEQKAISLLMTVDLPVSVIAKAGADLAELLRADGPEVIATNATLGIPLALEVCHALGIDDCVVLQKTPKIHLADALSEDVRSVTTAEPQRLLLDRARLPALEGRRVVLIDDVVATGSSLAAALRLLRLGGAEVVAVGVILTEGQAWSAELGPDAELIRSLGRIPGFVAGDDGWLPDWS